MRRKVDAESLAGRLVLDSHRETYEKNLLMGGHLRSAIEAGVLAGNSFGFESRMQTHEPARSENLRSPPRRFVRFGLCLKQSYSRWRLLMLGVGWLGVQAGYGDIRIPRSRKTGRYTNYSRI